MDSVKKKKKRKKKDIFSFYVRLQSVLFSILFVHYFCWLAFTDRNHSGKAKTFLTMSFEVR